MVVTELIDGLTLYPHQAAFLEGRAYWSALLGGYGSGKTTSAVLWALQRACLNPGCRGLILEPSYGMVRDVLIPRLEEILEDAGLTPCANTKRRLREDEYILSRSGRPELTLANPPSIWLLRSAEIPQLLKGSTLAWLIADEGDLIPKETFDICLARVRDPKADLLGVALVGTPERFGSWLHDRIEGDSRQDGDLVIRAKMADVTGLPPSYYENLRSSYDELTFQQFGHGLWVLKTEGLIYTPPFSEDNIRPCPHRRGWPVVIGMDFNVDPFCFLACHEVDGCLQVFKQYRVKGCNSQSAAEILKRDYPDVPIEIWADSAGTQRRTSGLSGTDVEILRQAGLEVHWKTIQRANNKYNSLRAMIRNAAGDRRLFIDPSCSQLIRELRTLTYEEAAKAGADDHSTDALAYLVFGRYNPIQRDRWESQ